MSQFCLSRFALLGKCLGLASVVFCTAVALLKFIQRNRYVLAVNLDGELLLVFFLILVYILIGLIGLVVIFGVCVLFDILDFVFDLFGLALRLILRSLFLSLVSVSLQQ